MTAPPNRNAANWEGCGASGDLDNNLLPPEDASPLRPKQGISLNAQWRVVQGKLQWHLQHLRGDRWRDRSFCVTKAALLRCIHEYCGEADLTGVLALPDWHPDRQGPPSFRGLLPASEAVSS
jgi:hypothetical protein